MEFCGLLILLIVLLVNILIVNYVRKLERFLANAHKIGNVITSNIIH